MCIYVCMYVYIYIYYVCYLSIRVFIYKHANGGFLKGGIPKSSIFIRFSIMNHPAMGVSLAPHLEPGPFPRFALEVLVRQQDWGLG